MKILHLISTHLWSGPAEPTVSLCYGLQKKNHDITFACNRKRGDMLLVKVKQAGLQFRSDLTLCTKSTPFESFSDLMNLRKIIKNNEYDIIHCHFSNDHSLCEFARLLVNNKKTVLIRTIHSDRSLKKRFFQGYLLNRCDGIITTCTKHNDKIKKIVNSNNVLTVNINGAVDTEKFKYCESDGIELRKKFNIKKDTLLLGIVARFQEGRRHIELIKSFKKLADKNIKFLFVGRGELELQLKKYVIDLGLSNQIIFTGYYFEEDLSKVYSAMDIFVILREGNDATCRAILQAMSCGLPCIGINRAGMSEAIQNNSTGFLLNDDNNIEDNFSDIISNIFNNNFDFDLKKMGSLSRQRIIEHFSFDVRDSAVEKFYKYILLKKFL